MARQGILSKRLLILSGKGGVGKSTVAASLALLATRLGKRVVVVEIDTVPTVAKLLGSDLKVGYTPMEIAPSISAMNINGKEGMEDYLRGFLKSKRLAQALFRNKIYQYFVDVAPGVKELLTVGKLWDLVENQPDKSGRPLYDLVIADLPATGHGFSHLRMPQTAVDTLKIGFVKEEAEKVLKLLRDPVRAAVLIVTLAEEMPVNEALDLRYMVRDSLRFDVGGIFVNGIYPDLFEGLEPTRRDEITTGMSDLREGTSVSPLVAAALAVRKRRAMQDHHMTRVTRRFDEPLIQIPFLFEKTFGPEAITTISKVLEAQGVAE